VDTSDGTQLPADHKISGGPSVLFDAVAILPSAEGAQILSKNPAARDFVADAFAHLKFIAYVGEAMPLLKKAGVDEDLDKGCLELSGAKDAKSFVTMCRKLRFWEREESLIS
jgi:catalase